MVIIRRKGGEKTLRGEIEGDYKGGGGNCFRTSVEDTNEPTASGGERARLNIEYGQAVEVEAGRPVIKSLADDGLTSPHLTPPPLCPFLPSKNSVDSLLWRVIFEDSRL